MDSASITIVGAGIGGVVVALELLDSNLVKGSGITLLDAGNGCGSLQSYISSRGHVCEMGAGRYSTVLHPALDRLLERFGVQRDPYSFNIKRRQHGYIDSVDFGDVDLHSVRDHKNFFEGLAAAIGASRADRLCTLSGYEALRDHRFPALGGVDVFTTHPETFSEPSLRSTWQTPRHGFSQLGDRISIYLRKAGVAIRRSARVVAVVGTKGGLEIEIVADRDSRAVVHATQVVLAVPPPELSSIRMPSADLRRWLPDVVNVPLFKGYLLFDDAWWKGSDLDKTCVIAGNQLQKVYFDSMRRHISFYCDSGNGDYWNRLRAAGDKVFRATLTTKIEETVGERLRHLSHADEVVCRYWPAGITYVHNDSCLSGMEYLRLASGIYLVTNTFGQHPGWIEGTLTSAAAMVADISRS